MKGIREVLKSFEIGELRQYPKEYREHFRSAAVYLYCHGYYFTITSRKNNDYFTVVRIE